MIAEQIPAEIDPFLDWLRERKPRNVLEIGVRHGGTSAMWAELATGRVIGVDYPGPDSLGVDGVREVAQRLRDRFSNYTFIEGDSHSPRTFARVVEALDGESLDFLFLDGDHSFEGVAADWRMYTPLVGSGGCVAFHDIVDSALIRSVGHGVYRFWAGLEGVKREFSVGGEWGGIGVILR